MRLAQQRIHDFGLGATVSMAFLALIEHRPLTAALIALVIVVTELISRRINASAS